MNTLLELLYTAKAFKKEIERFVATLLLLTPPLSLSIPNSIEIALKSLWARWKTNLTARNLLATLIIGNDEATVWILDENRLDFLIDETKNMSNNPSASSEDILPSIHLFTEISYSPKIKSYLEKNHFSLDLFTFLSKTESSISLKKAENVELRRSFVAFITNSLLGTASEKQLAILLKDSLEKLVADFSNEFVTEVFLPILNSSTTVPVCFEAIDPATHRYVLEPCKNFKSLKSSSANVRSNISTLTTKILQTAQVSELQTLLDLNNLSSTLVKYQTGTNREAFTDVTNKLFKQKGEFLIIVETEDKLSSKKYAIYYSNKNPNDSKTNFEWNAESFVL